MPSYKPSVFAASTIVIIMKSGRVPTICLLQLWMASFIDSPAYLISTFSISLIILNCCFFPRSGNSMRLAAVDRGSRGSSTVSPRSIGGSIWSTPKKTAWPASPARETILSRREFLSSCQNSRNRPSRANNNISSLQTSPTGEWEKMFIDFGYEINKIIMLYFYW